jgi:hypothetical protein
MPIPTISALPTAPARTDPPATFVTRADAFVAALPTLRSEINTTTAAIDVVALAVDADGVASAASAVAAASSEAVATAAANFVGPWAGLSGALNIPSSVSHSDKLWMLLVNLADVTLSEPATANTDWLQISVDSIGGGGTSLAGSQTLADLSSGAISWTPSDYGQYIKLPAKAGLTKGAEVLRIQNLSKFPATVIDESDDNIVFIRPYSAVSIGLSADWISPGDKAGIESLQLGTNIGFSRLTNAPNTHNSFANYSDVLDMGGGLYIVKGTLGIVVYNAKTKLFGAPLIAGSVFSLSKINATHVLLCRYSASSVRILLISISGTAITTVDDETTTSESNPRQFPIVLALSETQALVVNNGNDFTQYRAVSITGLTTLAIGAKTQGAYIGPTYWSLRIKSNGVNGCLAYFPTSDTSTQMQACTASGTTITVGTNTSGPNIMLPIRTPYDAGILLDNGTFILPNRNSSNSGFTTLITVSGVALTQATTFNGSAISTEFVEMILPLSANTFFQQVASGPTQQLFCQTNTTGVTVTTGALISITYESFVNNTYFAGPAYLDIDGNLVYFGEDISTSYSYQGPSSRRRRYTVSGQTLTENNSGNFGGIEVTSRYDLVVYPDKAIFKNSKIYLIGKKLLAWGDSNSFHLNVEEYCGMQLDGNAIMAIVGEVGFGSSNNNTGVMVMGVAK